MRDRAARRGIDRFILEASNACLVDDVNIGDGVSEYVYDALGRRIEKRSGGGATRYLHDGARVAEEWDVPAAGSPALAASYVYGNYIDEVLTMRRGGVDYYYHADDQYNVVKLTDSAGQVVEGYDYGDYGLPEFFDAAGARLNVTASQFANPYLFTGRQWDAELGYYYYRNRYLDPAHGRFASRDPLGIWGDPLNLGNGYTYAGSNPWSLVDPLGLCSGNQSRLPRWGERSYPEEVFAVAKGYFWDTTVGAAIGIGKAAINYEDTFASARDTLNFAWEDPEGFRDAVGKAAGQAIENALENPESAGTAISGFVTTFFGGYGLVKGAANAAETTVDIAGDAARAATRARVLSNIAECQGARNASNFASDAYAAQLAVRATQNAKSGNVVLGKFLGPNNPSSYHNVALGLRATYFQLDNWSSVQAQFGQGFMWRINREFLDQQLNASKSFYFSHNPWNADGYFQSEVLHLLDRGANGFTQIGEDLWRMNQ